jgi:hypothetical protein
VFIRGKVLLFPICAYPRKSAAKGFSSFPLLRLSLLKLFPSASSIPPRFKDFGFQSLAIPAILAIFPNQW